VSSYNVFAQLADRTGRLPPNRRPAPGGRARWRSVPSPPMPSTPSSPAASYLSAFTEPDRNPVQCTPSRLPRGREQFVRWRYDELQPDGTVRRHWGHAACARPRRSPRSSSQPSWDPQHSSVTTRAARGPGHPRPCWSSVGAARACRSAPWFRLPGTLAPRAAVSHEWPLAARLRRQFLTIGLPALAELGRPPHAIWRTTSITFPCT
jgi:hypothetical protein